MKYLDKSYPLFFDQYINLGNDCQNFCSSKPLPNIALRIGVGICAKTIGRLQEVALNILLGSFKLTVSTIIAIYSVPAAAFGYTPNHHNLAKQGFRHIALALFYVLDIPLSLANIVNKYPQDLVEKIQKTLKVSSINLQTDVIIEDFNDISKNISQNLTEMQTDRLQKVYQKIQTLKTQNAQLTKEKNVLLEKYQDLSQAYRLLEKLLNMYKQIEGYAASS